MKKYCRNCYYPLPYKAKFCTHCGQKDSDGKVPVSDVMQQLWFRILHLESRSWRVLWRLFIPGQVSVDYFKGKRKRYPPPVQFFFVIMFFFSCLPSATSRATAVFTSENWTTVTISGMVPIKDKPLTCTRKDNAAGTSSPYGRRAYPVLLATKALLRGTLHFFAA